MTHHYYWSAEGRTHPFVDGVRLQVFGFSRQVCKCRSSNLLFQFRMLLPVVYQRPKHVERVPQPMPIIIPRLVHHRPGNVRMRDVRDVRSVSNRDTRAF